MAPHNVHYLGADDAASWSALVARYEKAIPAPTNAVAAAIVEGMSASSGGSDAAFSLFKGTGGKLDRLMWAAAGYRSPGDKFRAATDAAWWSKPFAARTHLYGVLKAWAQALDKAGDAPTTPDLAKWNPALAAGQPEAIADYLARAWEGLKYARASGVEAAAPIIKLPGRKPVPAPTLPDKPVQVPLPTLGPLVEIPGWVKLALVVGLVWYITKE